VDGCLNDVNEVVTGIDEEVNHIFFHKFIDYGGMKLFAMYIVMLQSNKDALCPEYDTAGLADCFRSMDATYVMCKKVFHCMRQGHLGFKMTHAACIDSKPCLQDFEYFSCHPGSWNDNILVLFDDFAMGPHHDSTTHPGWLFLLFVGWCKA